MKILLACALLLAGAAPLHAAWFKGNTHTHTLNSDGDAPPDVVARWYREHDYQFVVITDHEYLTDVAPLNALYAREDEFLVIAGEEVTQHLGKSRDPKNPTDRPGCHVNGINLKKLVRPIGPAGKMYGYAPPEMTMADTYDRNIREIRAAGGIAQVNHPNWHWSVRLDDLLKLPDGTLLEIWNGQPGINNLGGTDNQGTVALSTEALWDELLSRGKKIWGVGADDSHNYGQFDKPYFPTPGRAWVVVRAEKLTADDITAALAKGDFYASNGVFAKDYRVSEQEVSVDLSDSSRGPRYWTRFIGNNGKLLAEVTGSNPRYRIRGGEGYVRTVVTDSNGLKAWFQPVFVDPSKSYSGRP